MILESDSIENEKIHKQNTRNECIWFFIPKLDSLSNPIYRLFRYIHDLFLILKFEKMDFFYFINFGSRRSSLSLVHILFHLYTMI
jgi:hypothetical protein